MSPQVVSYLILVARLHRAPVEDWPEIEAQLTARWQDVCLTGEQGVAEEFLTRHLPGLLFGDDYEVSEVS